MTIVVETAPVAASQNIVVQARPAPAFQSNAFFNPGFQTTSFSQQAFQKCAFQYSGFQTDECETGGRSGYWRLFFTKMQEESLQKTKEAIQQAVKETISEQVEGQAAPQRARKAKARKPAVVAVEHYPEVRFKRKPIFSNPQPVVEQFPAWLSLVSLEIDSWFSTIIPLWEERKQVIIFKQQEAANDADVRLRLLLLAA